MKLFGDDWLSLRYVQRYPESARIDEWASHPVHIQTENGIWRHGGHGTPCGKVMPGFGILGTRSAQPATAVLKNVSGISGRHKGAIEGGMAAD